jgi:TATA-binding protein-associated factor Taf7
MPDKGLGMWEDTSQNGSDKKKLNTSMTTWNEQGINTKWDEIIEDVNKFDIDVIAIKETNKKVLEGRRNRPVHIFI